MELLRLRRQQLTLRLCEREGGPLGPFSLFIGTFNTEVIHRSMEARLPAPARNGQNASAYLLAFLQPEADRVNWQHAALIIEAAENSNAVMIGAATRQLKSALFVSYRLDLKDSTLPLGDGTSKRTRSSPR